MTKPKKIKRLFYFYQRVFWFVGMANGEIRKPLIYSNEALQLMTYLAVIGIQTKIWIVALVYLVIIAVMTIIGKLYVISGAPKYLSRISNEQNPEFLKILKDLEEIKEKLNNKNG